MTDREEALVSPWTRGELLVNNDRRATEVGVIVPSSNRVVEDDFSRFGSDAIRPRFARAFLAETTPEAEMLMLREHVPQAARDLESVHVELLVFACTSAGALIGIEGEADLIRHLEDLTGTKVVSTNEAVADALAEHPGRVAVLTAYVDELNDKIARSLNDRGIEVASMHGLGITDNARIADRTPSDVVAFAESKLAGSTFDSLFVSCTNLRAFEAMPALERRFGCPVVTSNSATMAAVERHAENRT